jgi:dTDP-4-amino-4,6-dideoxygalactose transaminase
MTRVFLSPPDVGGEERQMLLEAFDSNWIAPTGPDVDAFEREIAERTGVAHAVALSSGTAALHLALLSAGVERGDEVLCPSFTFIASAAAITYVGAKPVFVDCSVDSWNLDPALVEEVLTEKAALGRLPSAVITVDLYGETADYLALESLCRRFEVPLIEDSAEALGANYRGRAAGSFGVAGIFSFNGNKIITTSGGGMLVTQSSHLAERARHLATQAREPFPHYEHATVGYNYRLSNLLAALGRAQLRGLAGRMERRQRIDAAYTAGFSGVPGISLMPRTAAGTSNFWLTCILIDPEIFGADREAVRLALETHDIESRPTWKPLHLQPAFKGVGLVGVGRCEHIFGRGLCLPTGSALSPADQSRVMEIVTAQGRVGP